MICENSSLCIEHALKVDERLRLARQRREQQQKELGKTNTKPRLAETNLFVVYLNLWLHKLEPTNASHLSFARPDCLRSL